MRLEVGTVVEFNFKGNNYYGTIVSIEKTFKEWDDVHGFNDDGFSILEGAISGIKHKNYIKDDVLTIEMDGEIEKYKFDRYSYTITSNNVNYVVSEDGIISIIISKDENIKNILLSVSIWSSNNEIGYKDIPALKVNKIEDIKDEVINILNDLNLNYNDFKIGDGSIYTKVNGHEVKCLIKINNIALDYLAGDEDFSNIMVKYIFDDLEIKNRFKFNYKREDRNVFKITI